MRVPNSLHAQTWAARLLLLGLIALTTVGCKPKMSGTSPESASASGGEAEEDPLAQLARLEQQMDELGLPTAKAKTGGATETKLEADAETLPVTDGDPGGGDASGTTVAEDSRDKPEEEAIDQATANDTAEMPVASEPEPHPPSPRSRAQQCEQVCDLSEAICDLELLICSLSDNHGGDSTYTEACGRASDDCVVAGDACDRCG